MIEVSMKCPCGTHAVVDITPAGGDYAWSAYCPSCLDPTEDSGCRRSHLHGYGKTPELAIEAWWERVELEWDIDYLPNTLFAELSEQSGDEWDRQSGWVKVSAGFDQGVLWGPTGRTQL